MTVKLSIKLLIWKLFTASFVDVRDGEDWILATAGGSHVVSNGYDVSFPDWRQIIPNDKGEVSGELGLNLAYVSEFQTILKKADASTLCVRINWKDALSPVRFSVDCFADCSVCEYIVMPVRI